MTLKLYIDLMSQPCRALYIIFKSCNIQFELVNVDLAKGEHFTPEYTKIHPFNKVPAIDHNGFILTESVAIVQYLKREKIIPEKLFPSDSHSQARIEEFLLWHQMGLRAPCALYFLAMVIEPMLSGSPPNPRKIESRKRTMDKALDLFEKTILGQGRKYVAGDTLTVADIFGCCEIEQPKMAGYDPTEGRPNLAAWMNRVKSELTPSYNEAHRILDKIATKRFALAKL